MIREQIIGKEFELHVTFSTGEVEIVEMTIGKNRRRLTVSEFEVDERLRVAAVRRAGRTYIPDGTFALVEGDLVVAAAKEGTTNRVGKYLKADRDDTGNEGS